MSEQVNTTNEGYTNLEKDIIKKYAGEYLYDPKYKTPVDIKELKTMINTFIESTTRMMLNGNNDPKMKIFIEGQLDQSLQSFFNFFSLLLGESDYTNEVLTQMVADQKHLDLTESELMTIREGLVHLEHQENVLPSLKEKQDLNINSIRSKLGNYQIAFLNGLKNE